MRLYRGEYANWAPDDDDDDDEVPTEEELAAAAAAAKAAADAADCCAMSAGGLWRDASCASYARFVCELEDPVVVETSGTFRMAAGEARYFELLHVHNDSVAGAGGAGALLGLSLAIAPLDGSAAFSTRVSGACLGGRGAGRARARARALRAPPLSPALVSRSS